MKTTLSIEQSARLIELGVDAKLASNDKVTYNKNGKPYCQPIYSLTDILSILPKEIYVRKINLSLVFEWQCDKWYACYMGHGYMKEDCSAPELIDALYQLLIWSIENR